MVASVALQLNISLLFFKLHLTKYQKHDSFNQSLIEKQQKRWDKDHLRRKTELNIFSKLQVLPKKRFNYQKLPSKDVFKKRCFEYVQLIYRITPFLKRIFKMRNHTSAWVFFCKFAAFFRTAFPGTPLKCCLCFLEIFLLSIPFWNCQNLQLYNIQVPLIFPVSLVFKNMSGITKFFLFLSSSSRVKDIRLKYPY